MNNKRKVLEDEILFFLFDLNHLDFFKIFILIDLSFYSNNHDINHDIRKKNTV